MRAACILRLNFEASRRRAPLPSLQHLKISRLCTAPETVRVEQRLRRAICVQPVSIGFKKDVIPDTKDVITAVRFPRGSGTEIAAFSLDLNREETMMLELTESAANALKRAIGRDQGEAKRVRIALVPSGCAEFRFKLDLAPAAGDNDGVFETQGVAMFVNRTAAGFIKGTRIDYVESLEGGSFIFQNPNAESTCVCGRSFTPSRDMFYAVCTAESIEPGWVKPFMLEKAGTDGAGPFPILIARDNGNGYFAYVNNCPREPHILYEGPGRSLAGAFLLCARHEAKFEMKTGQCTKGPGKGARLARIPVKVLDGEVCVSGVTLVEEEEPMPPPAAV